MREELNKYKSGMLTAKDLDGGEDEGITADDADGAGGASEGEGEVKQVRLRRSSTLFF